MIKDKIRFLAENSKFKEVDSESAGIMNLVTGSELIMSRTGSKVNMCKGIRDLRREERELGKQEGIKEGIKEGKKEGIKEGMEKGSLDTLARLVAKGTISLTEAAQEANLSQAEFRLKTGI